MATWYITDGDLPYLNEFPDMFSVSDAPNSLWRIIDDSLPYKLSFPQIYEINDAPTLVWRITNGSLPTKLVFPENYGITDVPLGIWAIKDGELPYRRNFPPMPGPPRMWGSPTKILLKEMHTSPILLKTQKSQDVQIGDTTIPHQITKRLFDGIDWELI